MPTIILKDENGKAVIDPLTGKLVREEVSEDVAKHIQESDRYIASQHDNDQRHFQLIHFDMDAWENMHSLSTGYSVEDELLNILEDTAEAERAHYMKRLARCRCAYRLLREACTPTQWRRFILNRYHGLTTRQIAKMDGCHHRAVWKSIVGVEKKIEKIFSQF